MKSANYLQADYEVGGNVFKLNFNIDNQIKSYISIKFPFKIENFNSVLHDHLASACISVLASLSLPDRISLSFAMPQKKNFDKAIKILYDIKSYSEKNQFKNYPQINCLKEKNQKIKFKSLKESATLLWSGGLDSTYSYILLKNNGYDVNLIHTNINIDQSKFEQKSISSLSKILNVNPYFVFIDFPDIKNIGVKYSNKFAKFPSYNSIPFGRDIIHIFIALYFNIKYKAKNICLGHEYELWKNYIYFNNKVICRNDFQSEIGSVLMDNILKNINKNLHFFSPVAAISKFKIYNNLFKFNKDILNKISFCYFGNNCGQCSNCFVYRFLQNIMLHKNGNMSELKSYILGGNITGRETFSKIVYCYFYELAYNSGKEVRDLLSDKLGDVIYKNREEIFKSLNKIHKVKLTPRDFRY